jgi:transcriptional regulator with XRE-family HTH domain
MKQLRVERGMTLAEFSRQLGVSFQQIQKYEQGSNGVTLERLLRAASILQVGLETFWQDATDETLSAQAHSPSDRGAISLVKAYRGITNPQIRQKLLELARKIAETDALLNKK